MLIYQKNSSVYWINLSVNFQLLGKVVRQAHMVYKFRKCCIIKMLTEPSMCPNQVIVNKHFNLTIIFVIGDLSCSFIFVLSPLLVHSLQTRFGPDKVLNWDQTFTSVFIFLAKMHSFAFWPERWKQKDENRKRIEIMPPKKLPRYSRPKKAFMFFF